jgi:phosphoribosylformylglycinamidine synthase subunit PurS
VIWLARVYVTLKPLVNDPQGLAIRGALRQLGFDSAESVRAGKYIEVRLQAPSEEAAGEQITRMCQQLLANPVIEDFRYELTPAT